MYQIEETKASIRREKRQNFKVSCINEKKVKHSHYCSNNSHFVRYKQSENTTKNCFLYYDFEFSLCRFESTTVAMSINKKKVAETVICIALFVFRTQYDFVSQISTLNEHWTTTNIWVLNRDKNHRWNAQIPQKNLKNETTFTLLTIY